MFDWRKICATVLLATLIQGCSQQEMKEIDEGQTQQQPPPKFNLQQVQKDYQDVPLQVLDISERDKDGRNAIAVTLSVPLDPSVNHQDYLTLVDNKSQKVDGAWSIDPTGKIAWFTNTEPAMYYLVTIDRELTAANGQSLSKSVERSLNTRDLKATVSFNAGGSYLLKGLAKGLPVVTVNVPEVNVDFFRIDDKKVQAFLSEIDQYYWGIENLTQYGQLVYSGRYDLTAPKNTRTQRNIDISQVKALQPSGLYLAILNGAGKYTQQKHLWFMVTDIGLHTRFYGDQIDVHLSSLKTGKALKDVEVNLYNSSHNVLKTVKSDKNGLARFSGVGNNVKLITAHADGQYSLIQTKKPALDLSSFELGSRPQLPVELYIYAARDLYRPGEVIDFNGLIRDGDGNQTKAPVLRAEVKRPDGTTAANFNWQPQNSGYYHQLWQIPNDAPVGDWLFTVEGPFARAMRFSFKVEEFLPERMKLTFNNDDKSPIVSNGVDPIKVPVKGEYLYGAPGSGNRISTIVTTKLWRNPVAGLKQFEFGHINSKIKFDYYQLEDIMLDHLGEGELKVASNMSDTLSPLKIGLVSSLYESGGRPVTRSYWALVWPKPQMLGIRSHFDPAENAKGPKENSQVKFDIVKASLDGQLHQAKQLAVSLIREDRQYFWVYSDSRGWHYDWSEKEFVEMSKTLDIKADSHGSVAFHVEYGHYRLEVRDPADGLVSSVRFFAGTDWYARWKDIESGAQGAHPDKVVMVLDKADYKIGDVAKVKIVPPQDGEAIVMVEGERPLWFKRIKVEKQGTTVEIPINRDWQRHNLYVTSVVLRGADNKQAITPRRSFGLVHLPLNRQNRKLEIVIDTPDKWLPEQTVEAKLTVKGSQSDGPLYLTLAAVDVGVLNITDFATPDPNEHFFGRRAYTVHSRDIYDNIIELNQDTKARLRFGGDADLSRGGQKPKSDVQIVSLFQSAVEVKDGRASVKLNLPAFNGRLKLMALAFNERQFGSAEKEVTVASPVVTQIGLPRFLAMGDKSTVALDISNLSGTEQNLSLTFKASGSVAMPSQQQNIKLSDQQKQTLMFPIEAIGIDGTGEFVLALNGLEVDGQTSTMNRRWDIGVRPAYPATTFSEMKVLHQGQSYQLPRSASESMLPSTINGQITVSNRINLNLNSHLKNLLQYPYGCLEQTSSRAYVLTYADAQRQKAFNLKPLPNNERLKQIQSAIERVMSMQLTSGGFGLWSNRSAEEHWLSAYVADFLLNAKKMGIEVDYNLEFSALRRLSEYLSHNGRYVDERYSEDAEHYNFAYKAYAAYVLSRVNRARLSALRALYNKQFDKARTGLPQLHLGLALYRAGDRKLGVKAIGIGLTAILNQKHESVYLGNYGSSIRDKALAIHLLLSNGIAAEAANDLAPYLAEEVYQQRWLSTQERNALFLAGVALQAQQGKQWEAQLFIGEAQQKLQQQDPYVQTLNEAIFEKDLKLTSNSEASLFVTSNIVGYGKTAPAPSSNGFEVSRQWYDTEGHQISPQSVEVGDLVVVRLHVSSEKRRPDALAVDLLPSGFELENQNLSHAIKLDEFKIDGQTIEQLTRYTEIAHMEYRDDRFVAALQVNPYRGANVFYLMRAVTPGTYIVPAPFVEDMYRPTYQATGETLPAVTIVNPSH